MPIYEYQCLKCGHELEAMQKMSDTPLSTCPLCNEEELRKNISAAGFRLKGTGWYETDFKNSGKNQSSKAKDGSVKDKNKKIKSSTTKKAAAKPVK